MKFYHGTSEEKWKAIQEEGILFGRRYVTDNKGNITKEVDRCTYLATDIEEAQQYGDIVLEVEYNPYNDKGIVKKDKRGIPINNYIPNCWQVRVYEPIPLTDIKQINMSKVVNIEENMAHKVSEVICVKCGKRWIAVRPTVTKLSDIECPNCGQGYVIETGEDLSED